MESIFESLLSILGVNFIVSTPSAEIVQTRKEIIETFQNFSNMIWANGPWDLWNRAAREELSVSSMELGKIRSDMNELKSKIKDVYGFTEIHKIEKILEIFDRVSKTKPTKSTKMWYYYPAAKEIIYESEEIMLQQMCMDFENRLKEEVHSKRILNCLFFRPGEFCKELWRNIKIAVWHEPNRLRNLAKENKEKIEKKIPGWFT